MVSDMSMMFSRMIGTLAVILVFNLIAGLIPVFATMRKTPAQILARPDI